MRYYFVATSLPLLSLRGEPELSFAQLKDDLAMNLTDRDLQSVRFLLEPIDLYNIKAFWLGSPLDERGTILGKELEEALLVREPLPAYVSDFLDAHDSDEERLRYFPSLVSSMYLQKRDGFLSEYYAFEREVSCVLSALRAKKLGRDIVQEFQFEDPTDPFIAAIIAQKDAPEYVPPAEYEALKVLFVDNNLDPRKLAESLSKYRFEKLEEWESREHFTLDRILAYAARLLLVESVMEPTEEDLRAATDIIEELSEYG